jgi:hypothetical protein
MTNRKVTARKLAAVSPCVNETEGLVTGRRRMKSRCFVSADCACVSIRKCLNSTGKL